MYLKVGYFSCEGNDVDDTLTGVVATNFGFVPVTGSTADRAVDWDPEKQGEPVVLCYNQSDVNNRLKEAETTWTLPASANHSQGNLCQSSSALHAS